MSTLSSSSTSPVRRRQAHQTIAEEKDSPTRTMKNWKIKCKKHIDTKVMETLTPLVV